VGRKEGHPHEPRTQQLPAGASPRADPEAERQPGPGDAYVAEIVARAPTPEAGRTIAEAYAKYGTAFALYLALDGTEKYVRDDGPNDQPDGPAGPSGIEADFKNVYYGRFEDREAIIDDTIASFDWDVTLRQLLRDHPDLAQMVVFDRDAIWGFVSDHYEIVDDSDGLYVFERWP
jgi:hypothetical protein